MQTVERIDYVQSASEKALRRLKRPPDIYFIAMRAKAWGEVETALKDIVFADALDPYMEKELRKQLRDYAMSVFNLYFIRRKKGRFGVD
jgi:hypothetical protein